MNPIEILFAKIDSVDEAKREVHGVAAEESIDKDKEIFDYESSKPELQKWSSKIEEVTEGKSLGNVRLMHGPLVAGKVINLGFDDLNKRVTVTSKVLNDDVWKLILEGGLTGYSFGGKKMILGNDNGARRYKAIPAEVSYVDNPCLYGAHFTSIKADGATEMRKFAHSESALLKASFPDDIIKIGEDFYEVRKLEKRDFSDEERKKLAGEGKALPDGSFPIESVGDLHNAIQAVGRASDPAKAKAHIRARAKALGRTDLLPDSWGEGAEKFFSPGEEPMNAEELKKFNDMSEKLTKFDDLSAKVEKLTKMSEAQHVHLLAMKVHHDGMGEHLNSMCAGESGDKAAAATDLKKDAGGAEFEFVAAGKTTDGVEVFKKVAKSAPNPEVIELKAKVDGFEKVLTELNKGIKDLFGKKETTVVIPGYASAAAAVTSLSKSADGSEPKKDEDLKKFSSAAEAAKDVTFIRDSLGKPFGSELELAAATMRKSAAA